MEIPSGGGCKPKISRFRWFLLRSWKTSSLFIYISKSVKVCLKTDWTVLQSKCENLCSKFFQVKCKLSELCKECVLDRRKKIYAKIYFKYNVHKPEKLVLWTLGTNWKGNSSYKDLQKAWTNFRKSMYHVDGFSPVFRVTEQGSKSGHLHIHFLNTGFLSHARALYTWRRVSNNSGANVNYSSKESDPTKAINYLMKYMTKHPKFPSINSNSVEILRHSVKYSWLGEWYKIKFDKYEPPLCKHGKSYSFYNMIYQWDGLFNEKIQDYFNNN